MEDILLKEHVAPESSGEDKVSVEEINAAGFDVKSHFAKDTIATIGNWLVTRKSKSWGLFDLMVLDSATEVRQTFAEFSREELESLFNICLTTAVLLREQKVEKIYIGANINHGFSDKKDVFKRLHMHVLGLRKIDFDKMTETNLSSLEEKSRGASDLIIDPMVDQFAQKMTEKFSECRKYRFGVCFEIKEVSAESLSEKMDQIDRSISSLFPGLSYSCCLVLSSESARVNITPRSVFGKGVLESEGILLRRSKELDFSKEELQLRDSFFNDVFIKLAAENGPAIKGELLK